MYILNNSSFIYFYILLLYFQGWRLEGRKIGIKCKSQKNNNNKSTKSAQFLNEMKGGHTATQNDTRKNTRRSHTLQVQNTH